MQVQGNPTVGGGGEQAQGQGNPAVGGGGESPGQSSSEGDLSWEVERVFRVGWVARGRMIAYAGLGGAQVCAPGVGTGDEFGTYPRHWQVNQALPLQYST